MTEEDSKIPARLIDDSLDVGATLVNLVPQLGGAIANVMTGIANDRRMKRIDDVLTNLGKGLKDFESTVAKEYVKKEEFEDLLDITLRQSSNERNESMRIAYAKFLMDSIVQPKPFDQQKQVLQIMGQLQYDHLRVLMALDEKPAQTNSMSGSPSQTLQRRLSNMTIEHIRELVGTLEGLRLISILDRMGTMMTAQGAEELRGTITNLGRRILTSCNKSF